MIPFLWAASRGNRLTPWRSPYLRWRIETYAGIPANGVTFSTFWTFVWRERWALLRYLLWVERMRENV
jgi:hypothetical protein